MGGICGTQITPPILDLRTLEKDEVDFIIQETLKSVLSKKKKTKVYWAGKQSEMMALGYSVISTTEFLDQLSKNEDSPMEIPLWVPNEAPLPTPKKKLTRLLVIDGEDFSRTDVYLLGEKRVSETYAIDKAIENYAQKSASERLKAVNSVRSSAHSVPHREKMNSSDRIEENWASVKQLQVVANEELKVSRRSSLWKENIGTRSRGSSSRRHCSLRTIEEGTSSEGQEDLAVPNACDAAHPTSRSGSTIMKASRHPDDCVPFDDNESPEP